MNINQRLNRLEQAALNPQLIKIDASNWFALRDEFIAADPAHEKAFRIAQQQTGRRGLRSCLLSGGCPELGRLLGAFCRQRRYRVPGAKLIRMRHGASRVLRGPNGELLQFMSFGGEA